MNNLEMKRLCERVGKRLTNKPVSVRFQQPAYRDAKGTACKRNRTAVVDIRPGMSSEEFLNTFLHECGHVKTLWGSWTVKVPDYKPGSLRIPASFRTAGTVKIAEEAANVLAEEWLNYAERYASKYEGSWLVSRLKSLEHYLEPKLLEMQEKAVNKAVDGAVERVLVRVKGRVK